MKICDKCGEEYDDTMLECPACEKEKLNSISSKKEKKSDSKQKTRDRDEKVRKRGFISLGAYMLTGFFLQVLVRSFVRSPGSSIFSDMDMPVLIQFLFIYPLIAGIAVIVIASIAKGVGRSISLFGVSIVFVLVLLTNKEIQELLKELFRANQNAMFGNFLSALGIVAIYSGSRATYFRPQSIASRIIAGLGGGIYLLSLLLPTQPKELGVISLMTPFKIISSGPANEFTILLGSVMLINLALLIISSVLCLCEAVPRQESTSRPQIAYILWRLSWFAVLVTPVIGMFMDVHHGGFEGVFAFINLLVLAILYLSYLPLYFIIPAAGADLLVNAHDMITPVLDEPEKTSKEKQYSRMASLKRMLASGLISEEEYKQKKEEILKDL